MNLLVIDDEPIFLHSIRSVLPTNWRAYLYSNFELVPKESTFHAALVDMHLRGETQAPEGPEVIGLVRKTFADIEIVGISGHARLELMEKSLAFGATKFLSKPFSSDELQNLLGKIEAAWQLKSLKNQDGSDQSRWIGSSKASQIILRQIAGLKGERGAILIEGETGTGKEVTLRLLNQQEPGRSLTAVNLGSVPESLFESEFFGHVRGAFTGADSARKGFCQTADGGDLFLDEIEALPMSQQPKLLRFLETGEFRSVGSRETQTSNVRVIAASNESLFRLVAEGRFREDLYYRLHTHQVNLPPLSKRLEDLPELCDFFLTQAKPKRSKVFSPEALLALELLPWPGNIRQLKRFVEQVSLISPLPIIRETDVIALAATNNQISGEKLKSDPEKSRPLAAQSDEKYSSAENPTQDRSYEYLMANYEVKILSEALSSLGGDIDKMALHLKMSRSTLYRKLKALNIEF